MQGWIISLLIAIGVMGTVIAVQWKGNKGDCDESKAEVKRLNQRWSDHLEEDNQRLKKRLESMDSANKLTQKIITQ